MKRFLHFIPLLVFLLALAVATPWLSRPSRTNEEVELFQGISYRRQARSSPRPLMIHVIKIDLSAAGIGFLVTPGDTRNGPELPARTTSAFLSKFGVQVAINGGFFEPFHSYNFWDYYPYSGDPVDVLGLAISNGEVYSKDNPGWPVLCFASGHAEIRADGCASNTTQALAGDLILIEHKVPTSLRPRNLDSLHPRTVVAGDEPGHMLWLVVIDGRQPGYSEGVTLTELIDITLRLGVETALNLDGGGSSTLVMAGSWGARTLNAPIHTRIPMRQRPVGNHLGVYALPIP